MEFILTIATILLMILTLFVILIFYKLIDLEDHLTNKEERIIKLKDQK